MEDDVEAVTKEKLIEDLKVVARDVEELLRATASQTGEKIAGARAKAEESLQAAKRNWSTASDEILTRSREAKRVTEEYVNTKPWQAVGIAAGIGVLIGYLIGRR